METMELQATKISRKGKARYRLDDGTEGYVEEVVLHRFKKDGWDGVWSENGYWWMSMTLLYWDVIFARLDGVWEPLFGGFPSAQQDMPRDFFSGQFYARRQVLIEKRTKELQAGSLGEQLKTAYSTHKGQPCRPVEDWNKFSLSELSRCVELMEAGAFLKILNRLLLDFNENRRGIPDLLLWKGKEIKFVEVKGPGDRLRPAQRAWLSYLAGIGLTAGVLSVKLAHQSKAMAGVENSEAPSEIEVAYERLSRALKGQPVPAGFREAAIALRAVIRALRRDNENFDEPLRQLYLNAARENFIFGGPGPSLQVAESMPRSVWRDLKPSYEELGYSELSLLKKTDRKWIVEAWGEPPIHRSARELYSAIWEPEQAAFAKKRMAEAAKWKEEFAALRRGVGSPAAESREVGSLTKSQSTGCLIPVLLLVGSYFAASLGQGLL